MTESTRDRLAFYLNGVRYLITDDDAFMTVADWLRLRLAKNGTKIVCNEGDCGACSVLIGRPNATKIGLDYRTIDACIAFVFQLDRSHVVTVEGLGTAVNLSPVQDAMVRCHGSQCGFCTPGFVTTMHGMIESSHPFDDSSLRYGLSGNLCRCTGYLQILDAGKSIDVDRVARLEKCYPESTMLREFVVLGDAPISIHVGGRTLFVPRNIKQAVAFLNQHPNTTIVSGATDYGVIHNHGHAKVNNILCLANVEECREIKVENNVLRVGALATWIDIEQAVTHRLPDYHEILTRFGSPQIRQVGTIGGNLASGSPIADSVPIHLVLNSELELISIRGTRRVSLADFYLGYRQTALKIDELIASITTPLPRDDERVKFYKISKRHDMDISTLTFAIWLKRSDEVIADVRLAVGGAGPVVMRLRQAEDTLRGKLWSEDAFLKAGRVAKSEISPWTDVRGEADYRVKLTENLLLKYFHDANENAVP